MGWRRGRGRGIVTARGSGRHRQAVEQREHGGELLVRKGQGLRHELRTAVVAEREAGEVLLEVVGLHRVDVDAPPDVAQRELEPPEHHQRSPPHRDELLLLRVGEQRARDVGQVLRKKHCR